VAGDENIYFEGSVHLLYLWSFQIMCGCILMHWKITEMETIPETQF
jgi:hypothetical protein